MSNGRVITDEEEKKTQVEDRNRTEIDQFEGPLIKITEDETRYLEFVDQVSYSTNNFYRNTSYVDIKTVD